MDSPQIIKTPSGESMAVIPLDEYERLQAAAEMLDDVKAYDEAKRRLAAGEDAVAVDDFVVGARGEARKDGVLDMERRVGQFEDGAAGAGPGHLVERDPGRRGVDRIAARIASR